MPRRTTLICEIWDGTGARDNDEAPRTFEVLRSKASTFAALPCGREFWRRLNEEQVWFTFATLPVDPSDLQTCLEQKHRSFGIL